MTRDKMRKEVSYVDFLQETQKTVIEDRAHKSKAFVPIQIDSGNSVEIVQVDGGVITGLPEGEEICDSLIYTVRDTCMDLNITWIIELKGTKNEAEAKHAIKQITKSIGYMQDQVMYPHAMKYVGNRDYVFAAVAGAPDKTLPALSNQEVKGLCRKLMELSGMRKNVKDMMMLFCYIRPNSRCKKAELRGGQPPYDIACYHHNNGYIPYPSMLMKLIECNRK